MSSIEIASRERLEAEGKEKIEKLKTIWKKVEKQSLEFLKATARNIFRVFLLSLSLVSVFYHFSIPRDLLESMYPSDYSKYFNRLKLIARDKVNCDTNGVIARPFAYTPEQKTMLRMMNETDGTNIRPPVPGPTVNIKCNPTPETAALMAEQLCETNQNYASTDKVDDKGKCIQTPEILAKLAEQKKTCLAPPAGLAGGGRSGEDPDGSGSGEGSLTEVGPERALMERVWTSRAVLRMTMRRGRIRKKGSSLVSGLSSRPSWSPCLENYLIYCSGVGIVDYLVKKLSLV